MTTASSMKWLTGLFANVRLAWGINGAMSTAFVLHPSVALLVLAVAAKAWAWTV